MEIPELPEGFEVNAVWATDNWYYIQAIKDGYIHHYKWDGSSPSWNKEIIYRNLK
jgi:hypothetical protein